MEGETYASAVIYRENAGTFGIRNMKSSWQALSMRKYQALRLNPLKG